MSVRTHNQVLGLLWQIHSCLISGDKHRISAFPQHDCIRQNMTESDRMLNEQKSGYCQETMLIIFLRNLGVDHLRGK